ncbi:ion transporter [bacterium]|nr:ion transporter [bacterium]
MSPAVSHVHAAFHQPTTRIYRAVQGSIWGLIVLSIAMLVVETLLSEGSPAKPIVRRADRIVLVLFAIEIVLRVGSYRPPSLAVFDHPPIGRLRAHALARLSFLARPMVLVDIVSVLALFPGLRGLRALRLLRLFRTTRVFRYRNPFAIVLQAFEENGLLFTFAFSVLGMATLLGGISMFLVEVRHNPEIEGAGDGIWWALVTLTTVGFGDIVPVTLVGRIVAGVMMVAGMFTLALFAGIVGSSLVSGMLSIREEQFRMSDYVNHVIIFGYDESTHILLSALLLELDIEETRVVIMDDHDRPRELPPEFLWVQGDPTKESELDKVRLTHALAVIVSGARDMSPQNADARTILVTFTVRAFLEGHRRQMRHRRQPLYVLAEILDSENVGHARAAGADEVIETRNIGYSMIAHAVRHHGTATTMSRFMTSGAHNVYIGQVPGSYGDGIPYGDLLAAMQLSRQGGLIIGLRTPAGEEIINPPKSHRVERGSLLIYLAEAQLLEPSLRAPQEHRR